MSRFLPFVVIIMMLFSGNAWANCHPGGIYVLLNYDTDRDNRNHVFVDLDEVVAIRLEPVGNSRDVTDANRNERNEYQQNVTLHFDSGPPMSFVFLTNKWLDFVKTWGECRGDPQFRQTMESNGIQFP
ncbi:MAG: hypothetical protein RIM33_17660 [Alphaproteobacteria bacterium]